MATPVFVLGLQRSGTTWIANMLADCGAVAAVTADVHRGVHESIFFSHFARAFGPLRDPEARARFREAFVQSDYFLLTGLDPEVLDRALDRASDHGQVFDAVMQALAARQGCTHWLEKSPHHTLLADDLAQAFPEARFVCVTRRSDSLIASRLAAYGRTPSRGAKRMADILRGALANALYVRRLEGFAAACDRAMLLRYDDFVKDQAAGRAALVTFLGLAVPPEALVSAFAPNSSHAGRGTRKLGRLDQALIRAGDGLGRLVPLKLLAAVERRRRMNRGVDWPDWVWLMSGYRPS